MLSETSIVRFLHEHHLIDLGLVVDNDLQVSDASHRNVNFKIATTKGGSYFVKQAATPEKQPAVAHEAAVYKLLHSDPQWATFVSFLPRFHLYDPEQNVLVLGLERQTVDLRQYHQGLGRFPASIGAALGRGLAALHSIGRQAAVGESAPAWLQPKLPWVLSIHHPTARMRRDTSSANMQLIRIVQQFTEFGDYLDQLHGHWEAETLIHGDMKWSNCIVQPAGLSRSRRTVELKIVDWELATLGDPCWDVGSIFSEYLAFWLFSIPMAGEEPPEQFLELARYPLADMQPAIRRFWEGYVARMHLDAATSNQQLIRAVKYAAARLLQTTFEQARSSYQLSGNALSILQLSFNILQQPDLAAEDLLGLPIAQPIGHFVSARGDA